MIVTHKEILVAENLNILKLPGDGGPLSQVCKRMLGGDPRTAMFYQIQTVVGDTACSVTGPLEFWVRCLVSPQGIVATVNERTIKLLQTSSKH